MDNKLLRAISLQIGTIIGAGIFGLPYAFARAGLPLSLFYLALLTFLCLVINLAYAEVILRTPGDHQLTGYGRLYLGKTGVWLATLSLMAGSYGALLAYTVQMGKFAVLLAPGFGNSFFWSLGVFGLAAAAVVLGLKRISQMEAFIVPGMLGVVLLVIVLGLNRFEFGNLPLRSVDLKAALAPFGIIFFALSGSSVIPEVEEVLRQDRQKLKKTVLLGTIIPALIYLVFALAVVGISGTSTSEDAVSGLQLFLPTFIVSLGAILGLLTMFSSFLTLGFVLKEMFYRDFRLRLSISWLLSLAPPLLLFLLGARSFIRILEISGGVMGGLTGFLIISLYRRAWLEGEREPPFVLKLPGWLIAAAEVLFILIVAREVVVLLT